MSIALEVRVREMGEELLEQRRTIEDMRTRLEALEEARQEAAMSQRKTLRLDRAQAQ